MAPTKRGPGGEIRVIDSRNFPASKNIAASIVTVKPGGHPRTALAPERIRVAVLRGGKGPNDVFTSDGARTMDFNANDVGFVPAVAGHYVEEYRWLRPRVSGNVQGEPVHGRFTE